MTAIYKKRVTTDISRGPTSSGQFVIELTGDKNLNGRSRTASSLQKFSQYFVRLDTQKSMPRWRIDWFMHRWKSVFYQVHIRELVVVRRLMSLRLGIHAVNV